jgi:Ca2+-binding EF-hand superfamily protein
LCGGSIEEKIESAFLLFDIDDTKTFNFDEFTDFLGVMFRIFLNFLSIHNPHYKELDYRELTEQTADKCFSDLQKSPAGEISHFELMYWVTGKKFISQKKEQIMDKYRPPLKSNLRKAKIDRLNTTLKRILNSDDLISKIEHYRKTLFLHKINIYDTLSEFKAANSSGFFNRHDFSDVILKLLIEKKAIDPYAYDKKNVDDTINKLFSILDKSMDGIVDMDEIIGCTL